MKCANGGPSRGVLCAKRLNSNTLPCVALRGSALLCTSKKDGQFRLHGLLMQPCQPNATSPLITFASVYDNKDWIELFGDA